MYKYKYHKHNGDIIQIGEKTLSPIAVYLIIMPIC